MQQSYTRLKLDHYISSQKAIAKIGREIIGTNEDDKLNKALFFYGNWRERSKSTISGYTRAPQKRLKSYFNRVADVIFIDEFRTSQRCNKCFNQLQMPTERKHR